MAVFSPIADASVVSPNNNSQRIALSAVSPIAKVLHVIRISGATNAVFVKFGDGTVTATVNDILILTNNSVPAELIGVPLTATHAAFFSPGAPNVGVTEGILL